MRHLGLIAAFIIAYVGPNLAMASAEAVADLLPQYPRAELVEFEDAKKVATHELITGALRSKGGNIVPENSEFVTGRRIASTWFIPNEQRTDLVYRFYRERLVPKGTLLFECEGRECGSSNHWANNIFRRPILYGPPQYQHYFLLRIDEAASTYYVATYITMRGTRKLYVHADVIVREAQYTDLTGSAIVDALVRDGHFVIDAGAGEAVVASVLEAMQLEPLLRIAVVGHRRKQRGEALEQAITRSKQVAESYRARLIEAGVNGTRLQAFGVGPLAPMNRKVIDRLELVLISNDERA